MSQLFIWRLVPSKDDEDVDDEDDDGINFLFIKFATISENEQQAQHLLVYESTLLLHGSRGTAGHTAALTPIIAKKLLSIALWWQKPV